MHHLKTFPNPQRFEVNVTKIKRAERVNLLQSPITVERFVLNDTKHLIQI